MQKVSIVTPAYNARDYIGKTYESLRRQSYADWEWVIVDDGSTDGTSLLLDSMALSDKRIRVIHQANSGNAKMPRDRAVYESTGDLLLMLDADDWLDDGYLQQMVERLNDTDADIVYPTMVFMQDGRETHTLPLPSVDTTRTYNGRDMVALTIPDWQIGCNGGLYRRHVWVNMAYPKYDGRILMNTDELDERLYQLAAGKVAFSDAVYRYRIHSESTTKRAAWKQLDILRTNYQLLKIIRREFGNKSNEYRLMRQKILIDRKGTLLGILRRMKNNLR